MPILLLALGLAGCEAPRELTKGDSPKPSTTDGNEDSHPVVTDTDTGRVVTDTGGSDTGTTTTPSVAPQHDVRLEVDGQIMGLLSCKDEYLAPAVCYFSQFPGNHDVAPRTELHRISGSFSSGLTNTQLPDFVHAPDTANINAPVSLDLNGTGVIAVAYNASNSATVSATDSFESFGGLQSSPKNGVVLDDSQGNTLADLSFDGLEHDGYPLTGPVTPVVVDDILFAGAANYGNGSTEYQGKYGSDYGQSVLLRYDDPLHISVPDMIPVVDQEGTRYYALRSLSPLEDNTIELHASNESGELIRLNYNPNSSVFTPVENLGNTDVGYMASTQDDGHLFLTGDPKEFVSVSPDGEESESIDLSAHFPDTTFVSTVSALNDGSLVVSAQEETSSSTVASSLVWLGADGTYQTLASDSSAQAIVPHIQMSSGLFDATSPVIVGGISGSDRTDSHDSPWVSVLHFIY